MNPLYRKALLKADKIRMQLGLDIFEPINIFDTCARLKVNVRFVDLTSMEGMYVVQDDYAHPTILLSSERPLPRRCFSCGHELGHHVFKHGSRIDGLSDTTEQSYSNNSEEFLVDSFAGALLMPIAGIQAEFAKRNWSPFEASPVEFYTISSIFGTGYQTLIVHCRANKILTESKCKALLKIKPAKILRSLLSAAVENPYFKIIDGQSQLSVIDLEVSNYIILPASFIGEGDHLQKLTDTPIGSAYMAIKPGIIRIASKDETVTSFVRIQNYRYVGLAENRHLENEID